MRRYLATTTLPLCAILLMQIGGRSFAQEQVHKYVDDKFDFSITVSPPWKEARLQDYAVPGVARTAYAQPGGASIVVFVQEPGQAFDSRFLVDESAKSIEANLGAKVREKDVRPVGGKQAMWLIVEGNGTGGAIDGKGAVTTTQHWVAVPRQKDVVVALLTSPTSDFEERKKSFEKAIQTLVVGGSQTTAQAESK